HLGRGRAARLLLRDARGSRLRHVLVRVRGERHGSRHLDRPGSTQGSVGRVSRSRKACMRSVNVSSLGTIVLGALLTFSAAGCSKKTVAPGSQPTPEGEQDAMLMMGWREQPSIWFRIDDPGTPDDKNDDVLDVVGADFFEDPNGLRTSTFDSTPSNALEAMR